MTAVLADQLGPKARRRVTIASVIATAAVVVIVVLALRRLYDRGQLERELWEPFTKWPEFRFLLEGLVETVRVAAVAMACSIAAGIVLALGRLAQTRVVRGLFTVWTEFFRGIPVVLLIFFTFLGLPRFGLDWSAFWYLVLGLALYNSAVLGEIFRAGILSLERGQMEASLGIGLTYWQAMRFVIIPQGVRRMIPAIVSQLVVVLKDTALGYIIAYEELSRRADIYGQSRKNTLQAFFVASLLYLIVNLVLSRIARRLELRQRRRYSAGAIAVSGIEDLAADAAVVEARIADKN